KLVRSGWSDIAGSHVAARSDGSQLRGIDRQFAQPFARGGENRIDHGRPDGCRWRLAQAPRHLHALDEMNFHSRSLVDPQHLVGVEVRLLDAAAPERDLAIEGGRDPEHGASLDLRPGRIRVHDAAAVYRTDDTLDPDTAILADGHLRDLC